MSKVGCLGVVVVGGLFAMGGCRAFFNNVSGSGSSDSFLKQTAKETVVGIKDFGSGVIEAGKEEAAKVDWNAAGQKTREAGNEAIDAGIEFWKGFTKPTPAEPEPESP